MGLTVGVARPVVKAGGARRARLLLRERAVKSVLICGVKSLQRDFLTSEIEH